MSENEYDVSVFSSVNIFPITRVGRFKKITLYVYPFMQALDNKDEPQITTKY